MTFTVKQLKEQIANLPDDMVLVLQADDEGNGYRFCNGIDGPLAGGEQNYFDEDNGECHREEDLFEQGIKVKDTDYHLCAVLY